MALFSAADFGRRIMALYPQSWLSQPATTTTGNPDTNGVFTAICQGLGTGLAQIYSELAYVKLQSRLLTSTDVNIDNRAADYFKGTLPRGPGETDAAYILRIQQRIIAPLPTIAGLQTICNQWVAAYSGTSATSLEFDTSGGLDGGGGYDGGELPAATSPPSIIVFDTTSNPTLAAAVGLISAKAQFCILFGFPNEAAIQNWALGASGLNVTTYLQSPSYFILSQCPSPDLAALIAVCKAVGTQPVYAANTPNV